MIVDRNVEAVQAAREQLIQRHGGLKGWFDHLIALEKQRRERKPAKPRSKAKK
jgi:hypothetical protein